MRRISWLLVPALALASACNTGGEKAAGSPAADSTAEAPVSAAPAAIVTVLYNAPKDAAAFEKYYAEKHLPLVVASQDEIGFKRADLTKFESALDGKKPAFYRQAELYFDSMDDLQKGVATPGFKKVADDLNNFASGGLIGMVATATNDHESTSGTGTPAAIVTVIYKAPKDTAAFEKYYSQTHLPLVVQGQPEIGFTHAELTRFNANLDGSKPARYRQAELYFPSMDAAKKGTATPAFKKVGDDLANFASGGLDALIGVETK
jgi:uncharacterized protein (TIGR02118 family)